MEGEAKLGALGLGLGAREFYWGAEKVSVGLEHLETDLWLTLIKSM